MIIKFLVAFTMIAIALLSGGKSSLADNLTIISVVYLLFSLFVKFRKSSVEAFSSNLYLLIFLNIIVQLISVLTSVSITTSVLTWSTTGFSILFAFLASTQFTTTTERISLVRIMIIFSSIVSVLSFTNYIFGWHFIQYDISVIYPSYGHNRFAEFFLPYLPLSIYWFYQQRRNFIFKVIIIISFINFFISFSRASLISLAFIPAIIYMTKIRLFRHDYIRLLLLSCASILFFVIFTPIWLSFRSTTSSPATLSYIINKPFTVTDRFAYYRDVFLKLRSKPLFGFGQGTYNFNSVNFWSDTSSTIYTHNHFLQTLYESGFVGLFFELLFIVWVFSKANASAKTTEDKLLFLGICLSLVHAQMDFSWEIPIIKSTCLLFLFSIISNKRDTKVFKNNYYHKLLIAITLVLFICTVFPNIAAKFNFPFSTKSFENILSGQSDNTLSLSKTTLIRIWTNIESGNGSVYRFLFLRSLSEGALADAYRYYRLSRSSPYLTISITPADLYPLISRLAENPSALPFIDQFELLNDISSNYSPHDFYRISPDEYRNQIFIVINNLLKLVYESRSSTDTAKIYYWKYSEMLVNGQTKYEQYQAYIDKASQLDVSNAKYTLYSKINNALTSGNKDELSKYDALISNIPDNIKGTTELALQDHINFSLANIFLSKGDVLNELSYRRKSLVNTRTATFYIALSKRLMRLGMNIESDNVMDQCVSLYRNCRNY